MFIHVHVRNMLVCRRKATLDGQSRTMFGTAATISADNPASCALGGFKESTSAYRMCKCMATHTDAAEKVGVF